MPLPTGKNSLAGSSIFIFVARFFPSLATLLVIFLFSRRLSMQAYGAYQYFWIQLNVFYPLVCWGIHVLVLTYPPSWITHMLHSITGRQWTIYAFWVTTLCVAFAWLQTVALPVPFGVGFFFLLCWSLTILLESGLIVFRNFKVLVSVNIVYAALFLFVHWYALYRGMAIQQLFLLLLLLTAVKLLCYSLSFFSSLRHHRGYDFPAATRKTRTLWLHLGFYDVTQLLFNWVDKFAISLFMPATISAVYFNGAMNIPFLPLLLSAAASAVLMQTAHGQGATDTKTLVRSLHNTGRWLSCIVFPLFFFLLVFRYPLFEVLLSGKYAASVPIFALSILALPIRAYSFTTALQKMHRGDIINIGSVADLLIACSLMYPLYRLLGLPGVALSFVVSTYLQALYYLYQSSRLLGVPMSRLVPLADWLYKLIIFGFLFIAVRYLAQGVYGLYLGSLSLIMAMSISLWIAYKQSGNVEQQQATV
jgi:O-antigen/teichoic acid export membrane protein